MCVCACPIQPLATIIRPRSAAHSNTNVTQLSNNQDSSFSDALFYLKSASGATAGLLKPGELIREFHFETRHLVHTPSVFACLNPPKKKNHNDRK